METGQGWHPLLSPFVTVRSHQHASLSTGNRESSKASSLFPVLEGSSSDVPLAQAQGQDALCAPPLSVPSCSQCFHALSSEPPHIGSFFFLPNADYTEGRCRDCTVKRLVNLHGGHDHLSLIASSYLSG